MNCWRSWGCKHDAEVVVSVDEQGRAVKRSSALRAVVPRTGNESEPESIHAEWVVCSMVCSGDICGIEGCEASGGGCTPFSCGSRCSGSCTLSGDLPMEQELNQARPQHGLTTRT